MDQQPVPAASVMFIPEGKGRPAWAQTDAEGKFKLTTFKAQDGAPVGRYKVSVAKVILSSAAGSTQTGSEEDEIKLELRGRRKERETWLVPEKYANPKTSTLQFVVKSDSENNAIFELESQ